LKNAPRLWRHFFFGDTEEVLQALKRVAVQLQPNIEIVSAISLPFPRSRRRLHPVEWSSAFAPKWMQRLGLTLAVSNAGRTAPPWPRYLPYNSVFVYYLLRDWPLGPPAPGRIE